MNTLLARPVSKLIGCLNVNSLWNAGKIVLHAVTGFGLAAPLCEARHYDILPQMASPGAVLAVLTFVTVLGMPILKRNANALCETPRDREYLGRARRGIALKLGCLAALGAGMFVGARLMQNPPQMDADSSVQAFLAQFGR